MSLSLRSLTFAIAYLIAALPAAGGQLAGSVSAATQGTVQIAQSSSPAQAIVDSLLGDKAKAEAKKDEQPPQEGAGGNAAPAASNGEQKPADAQGNGEQATTDQEQKPAPADDKPVVLSEQLEEVVKPVRRIANQLEELEKTVERVKARDEDLARARVEIEKLPPEARKAVEAIQPKLAALKVQIEKLGPEAKTKEGGEAAVITAERTRLQKTAGQLESAIKGAELLAVRAQQLVERVQDLRQQIFTQQVLTPTKLSPLSPAVWKEVASEIPRAWTEIAAISQRWWSRASSKLLELGGIFALTFATYLGFRLLRGRVLAARLERPDGSPMPGFFDRAVVASWVAPTLVLPAVGALLIFYFGLRSNDLLYLQSERIARSVYQAALIAIIVFGLSTAILQPARAEWRLLDLSDVSAKRLNTLIKLVVIVFSIDLVMRDVIKLLFLPFQVSVAQAFIFSLIFAGLMLALARTPIQTQSRELEGGTEGDGADANQKAVSLWRPFWLKIPLTMLVLFIAGVALSGYVALARLTAAQVLLTGTVVVAIVLVHLAIRAIARDTGVDAEEDVGAGSRILSRRFGLEGQKGRQMDQAVYYSLNFILALLALPILLATWGFTPPEIIGFARTAVFGFDVGGVHISPTKILIAISLFIGLLFATRLLQRWLQATWLHPSRIDTGLANSIYTGVGYIGYTIAALVAVSYSGFDITNLAIVAGALSVGIGFGLQSIVNNFVSGLILLVERPIKVGDWISVGGYEGHVRRISVRSTEIETFNRSSVIVPNSELISGSVTNRTHRNALGRVEIAVGVGYDSDPQQVKDLLEKVASESALILKFPAPLVSFDNFGASSLDFTLRAYLADVNKSVSAASDLRIRIFNALKDAGIEIPFPQYDVHLRDLDFVKATVARVAAERAAKSASNQNDHGGGEPDGGSGVPMGAGVRPTGRAGMS